MGEQPPVEDYVKAVMRAAETQGVDPTVEEIADMATGAIWSDKAKDALRRNPPNVERIDD